MKKEVEENKRKEDERIRRIEEERIRRYEASIQREVDYKINKFDCLSIEKNIVVVNPEGLFDIAMKNSNFLNETVSFIINEMSKILFSPPYPILFGRIIISKRNQKVEQSPYKKEINELFYEGLGLEEFKYNRSQ